MNIPLRNENNDHSYWILFIMGSFFCHAIPEVFKEDCYEKANTGMQCSIAHTFEHIANLVY